MFDMRNLTPRYFEVRLPNGLRLEVEPPKLKVLKHIMAVSKIDTAEIKAEGEEQTAGEGVFESLAEGVAMALSKNKQKKEITTEFVVDVLNLDQIQALLTEYFNWVAEIKNSKN